MINLSISHRMGGRSAAHTHAQLACPTPPSDRETSPRKDTSPGWVVGGMGQQTRRGDARAVALGPVRSRHCYRRATQKQTSATDETWYLSCTGGKGLQCGMCKPYPSPPYSKCHPERLPRQLQCARGRAPKIAPDPTRLHHPPPHR